MTLQERADQLYPYRFPDKEEMLIEQYGTADDLTDYLRIIDEAEQLIKESKPVPESDIVRLQEIRTRAEHSFLEKTLRGDYELFKALVSLTVERYEPHSDLYQLQLPEPNPPEWKGFVFGLFLNCNLLAKAESFFGWDGVKNERGESFLYATLFDKAEQLYPGAREEIQERARQLAEWNVKTGFSNDQQPPTKKKKRKQIHLETRPAQALFTYDNVYYQTFEGLLEAADYDGQLQSVLMYTKSYKLQDGRRKTGKPVNVLAIMECKDADFSQPLDLIDGAILRAVYTLLDAGENRFTLSHVWNMIAGTDQRTNKSRIEDMCARVRRMIATTAKINYREYAEDNNIEYTDDITAQILPGVKLRERKNTQGETVEAELFCQLPLESFPLYQFAQHTGQIDRLTIEEATVRGLDVNGKAQALTDYRLIIREVLLRRITKRHSSPHDQVIRLTALRKDDLGLYDRVNAESPAKQLRARETAENFLCEWIQLGTLYAYAWRKTGKTFDAILIATTADEMKNFPGADWVRPAAADS